MKSDDILALGRVDPHSRDEPFNMAFLALRGSAVTIGVSRLHGEVARRIFQPLFPRWPSSEIPVGHVTNSIHIPTWVSARAGRIWDKVCGKDGLHSPTDSKSEPISQDSVSDEELWAMRGKGACIWYVAPGPISRDNSKKAVLTRNKSNAPTASSTRMF